MTLSLADIGTIGCRSESIPRCQRCQRSQLRRQLLVLAGGIAAATLLYRLLELLFSTAKAASSRTGLAASTLSSAHTQAAASAAGERNMVTAGLNFRL